MSRFKPSLLLWVFGAVVTAGPAAAQTPSVGFIFPPGGQAGTKATVNISGGNLQGATAVLLSGSGVKATIVKNTEGGSMPVELEIAPDAVPGLREVRVTSPRGTSNAGRIWVGAYPEGNEAEPNNVVAQPQKLEKLPVAVNGQINGGEDVDQFTFQANAGDTYVFDLVANRMASELDGYLLLTDARGKQLAYAQEGFDRDPRIIHTFKSAGTYLLQVRDSLYRGGANYTYKLTLGAVPVVTSYLPLGGRRGGSVSLALEGYNLGAMKTMEVAIPEGADEVTIAPKTPAGTVVSPMTLVPSELDQVAEYEPNDRINFAALVGEAPIAIDGRMDKKGDADYYKIKATAAGPLVFEIHGRRFGSRIDSFLRILDATGKEIAANDDAEGKDSRVAITAQANTEYIAEVRNQAGRFGGDVFYRLSAAPPAAQDFQLTVTPDEINLGQGGSAAVTVNVRRIGGFGGAIPLTFQNLPEGVTASHAVITAGAGNAQFTLTAAPGANPGALGLLKIIGTAAIGGQEVRRQATPVEIYRVPLAAENQTSQRELSMLPVTVMPATPITLDIEPRELTVKKGTQNVEVKIKVTRQMGQTAAITIAAAGQPANVAPVVTPVPANANEVVLKFNIAANAPTVTQNVIITGTFNNVAYAAPALKLTITD